MTLDMQKEIDRHQKGWEGFCRMLGIGTISVCLVIVLMALTLL